MGKEKYLRELKDIIIKTPIIDSKSIIRIIKNKKNVKQYDKQLIRNLILKGKLKRLTKGCYTTYNDPSLIVFCFEPAYLGLQDALSIHNVWDQETIPVIITSKKVRSGLRKVLGSNLLIRRLSKKYLFGSEYIKYGDFYYPVSDIEKTFIDMIYFNQKMDKDLIKNFKDRIKIKKVKNYLKRFPKKIKIKVLKLL